MRKQTEQSLGISFTLHSFHDKMNNSAGLGCKMETPQREGWERIGEESGEGRRAEGECKGNT